MGAWTIMRTRRVIWCPGTRRMHIKYCNNLHINLDWLALPLSFHFLFTFKSVTQYARGRNLVHWHWVNDDQHVKWLIYVFFMTQHHLANSRALVSWFWKSRNLLMELTCLLLHQITSLFIQFVNLISFLVFSETFQMCYGRQFLNASFFHSTKG